MPRAETFPLPFQYHSNILPAASSIWNFSRAPSSRCYFHRSLVKIHALAKVPLGVRGRGTALGARTSRFGTTGRRSNSGVGRLCDIRWFGLGLGHVDPAQVRITVAVTHIDLRIRRGSHWLGRAVSRRCRIRKISRGRFDREAEWIIHRWDYRSVTSSSSSW